MQAFGCIFVLTIKRTLPDLINVASSRPRHVYRKLIPAQHKRLPIRFSLNISMCCGSGILMGTSGSRTYWIHRGSRCDIEMQKMELSKLMYWITTISKQAIQSCSNPLVSKYNISSKTSSLLRGRHVSWRGLYHNRRSPSKFDFRTT